jgi:hypothetical protein
MRVEDLPIDMGTRKAASGRRKRRTLRRQGLVRAKG